MSLIDSGGWNSCGASLVGVLIRVRARDVCDRDDPMPQPLEHEGLGPDRAATSIDPADIGADHVDSPPLPPLVDRPGAYDTADDGPVDVSVTVLDDKAFAA